MRAMAREEMKRREVEDKGKTVKPISVLVIGLLPQNIEKDLEARTLSLLFGASQVKSQ